MSEMSYLEKLLDGVEVEWQDLKLHATIGTGNSNRQDESENGIYPFYVRSKNVLRADKYEYDETAIIIPGEGGIGDIFHYVEGKYALHQRAYRINIKSSQLNSKFIYYYMLSHFKYYILMKSVGATSISIRKPMLESFPIPIPCPDNPEKSLAIQSEIVRILDKFSALTAELTMRKKQYNYYRDQLLSFKEGEVNWTTLGNEELFHICAGGTPSKSKAEYWDNGSIPWLKSESCNNKPVYFSKDFISELGLKKSTAKLLPKNTTLIALVGATIFKTAFLEFEATTNQNIASIKSTKENIIADKFIFYFLTNLYNTLKSEMRNYGMLNLTNLRQFRIPIPCIAEQKRIVSILDKFDTLTNSITEGLPREIELRQKQYEYYRDLLFSFPKPETVSN
ncbi:restriction endonuclease subunit S [Escherichia coli]|nr:restriction endonuclease subunit S [Escherichia coli]